MRDEIYQIIEDVLNELFKANEFKPCELNFAVEMPKLKEHGDYSTNVAMVMAPKQKMNPRKIAEKITAQLLKQPIFEKAEIAGPGFINMWIKEQSYHQALCKVLRDLEGYGSSHYGQNKKVLIEFVSANPTGPLHLGHGRGAAFGDTLARILRFCGFEVFREFYINDAGRQVKLLGLSIYSRFRQKQDPSYPFPEDGYHGTYVYDLLEEIQRLVDLNGLKEEEAVQICSQYGKELMLKEIQSDLTEFGVHFDIWSSEKELYETGKVQSTIDKLQEMGFIYESEGAIWLKTTSLGDDKDRVIKKSDGEYTYFASDIAYHLDKWNRGYDQAIDIWGADHHGYIGRVNAALSCLNIPKEWLKVLLIQLVKLWSHGNEIKMSKRAGTYVTLREIITEAGVDASRFIFLTKHNDSTLDFDLDLAKKQDTDNPVYYIQYAHARLSSILRKSPIKSLDLENLKPEDLSNLTLPEEVDLIKAILDFPSTLTDIAKTFEPHRLTYYLMDIASLFHRYFNLGNKDQEKRVICKEESLTRARLCLVLAVRYIIGRGLQLLGVSQPESM